MVNLAMELAHLALADKHIAGAQERIDEATQRAEAGRVTTQSSQILKTMHATLAAYVQHRDLIVRTIKTIEEREAGRKRPGPEAVVGSPVSPVGVADIAAGLKDPWRRR